MNYLKRKSNLSESNLFNTAIEKYQQFKILGLTTKQKQDRKKQEKKKKGLSKITSKLQLTLITQLKLAGLRLVFEM